MRTYREADEIKLVYSGSDYFEVLEQMIGNSVHTLHLQTYIFEADATGMRIISALQRAAERGVKVYVLIDAYGSYPYKQLQEAMAQHPGIHFRLFSPLFSSESIYFGRRLHHKIIVADRRAALTGGINIANKYSGADGSKAWLDYAVLTTGPACDYLHLLCEAFYHKKGWAALKHWEKARPAQSQGSHQLVRFRRNDWINRKNEIHKSYTEAIISAESSITIVASYFLPGRTFRNLLKHAAARGVTIRIILAGKSDIGSLQLAQRYLYDFYTRHNICIYEWNNSVMHGKAMAVDGKWATIGSYNLNFLSHYISIELNTDIADQPFAQDFSAHLKTIEGSQCETIDLSGKKKTGPFMQLVLWITYTFYRALMSILMTGRKYRKRKKN